MTAETSFPVIDQPEPDSAAMTVTRALGRPASMKEPRMPPALR